MTPVFVLNVLIWIFFVVVVVCVFSVGHVRLGFFTVGRTWGCAGRQLVTCNTPGVPQRSPGCCRCLRPGSGRWTWRRCRLWRRREGGSRCCSRLHLCWGKQQQRGGYNGKESRQRHNERRRECTHTHTHIQKGSGWVCSMRLTRQQHEGHLWDVSVTVCQVEVSLVWVQGCSVSLVMRVRLFYTPASNMHNNMFSFVFLCL